MNLKMNLKAIKLTDKQAAVLPHLVESSWMNGHDFGFTDEVPFEELGLTRQGFAGVIASILKRRDIIAEYYDLSEDPGIDSNSTQFVFAESFLDTVVHPAEDEMYNHPVQKEEPAEDKGDMDRGEQKDQDALSELDRTLDHLADIGHADEVSRIRRFMEVLAAGCTIPVGTPLTAEGVPEPLTVPHTPHSPRQPRAERG